VIAAFLSPAFSTVALGSVKGFGGNPEIS